LKRSLAEAEEDKPAQVCSLPGEEQWFLRWGPLVAVRL